MAIYVLGAPGSGKTTVRRALGERLSERIVMDWDDLMAPASELLGADVRSRPDAWPAYRHLIRGVVDVVGPRLVLLGVCTPAELPGWPIDRWILLDCDDHERRSRLAFRCETVDSAISDADAYRRLGFEIVDSTGLPPEEVAVRLAVTIESAK